MPQTCKICRHDKRNEIDRALLAGEPYRYIVKQFGTSTSALVRHKADHIPVALSKAREASTVDYGDDLFRHVKDLNRRTLAILEQAEVSGDPRTALAAIRECRGNAELLAKMIVAMEASRQAVSIPESITNILLQGRLEAARRRVNGD